MTVRHSSGRPRADCTKCKSSFSASEMRKQTGGPKAGAFYCKECWAQMIHENPRMARWKGPVTMQDILTQHRIDPANTNPIEIPPTHPTVEYSAGEPITIPFNTALQEHAIDQKPGMVEVRGAGTAASNGLYVSAGGANPIKFTQQFNQGIGGFQIIKTNDRWILQTTTSPSINMYFSSRRVAVAGTFNKQEWVMTGAGALPNPTVHVANKTLNASLNEGWVIRCIDDDANNKYRTWVYSALSDETYARFLQESMEIAPLPGGRIAAENRGWLVAHDATATVPDFIITPHFPPNPYLVPVSLMPRNDLNSMVNSWTSASRRQGYKAIDKSKMPHGRVRLQQGLIPPAVPGLGISHPPPLDSHVTHHSTHISYGNSDQQITSIFHQWIQQHSNIAGQMWLGFGKKFGSGSNKNRTIAIRVGRHSEPGGKPHGGTMLLPDEPPLSLLLRSTKHNNIIRANKKQTSVVLAKLFVEHCKAYHVKMQLQPHLSLNNKVQLEFVQKSFFKFMKLMVKVRRRERKLGIQVANVSSPGKPIWMFGGLTITGAARHEANGNYVLDNTPHDHKNQWLHLTTGWKVVFKESSGLWFIVDNAGAEIYRPVSKFLATPSIPPVTGWRCARNEHDHLPGMKIQVYDDMPPAESGPVARELQLRHTTGHTFNTNPGLRSIPYELKSYKTYGMSHSSSSAIPSTQTPSQSKKRRKKKKRHPPPREQPLPPDWTTESALHDQLESKEQEPRARPRKRKRKVPDQRKQEEPAKAANPSGCTCGTCRDCDKKWILSMYHERRISYTDGMAYTRQEFIDYFGDTKEWDKAKSPRQGREASDDSRSTNRRRHLSQRRSRSPEPRRRHRSRSRGRRSRSRSRSRRRSSKHKPKKKTR